MYMINLEKQHLHLIFIHLIDNNLEKFTTHCQFLFKMDGKCNTQG
ncbi:MAG: hypothetical protein ACJA2N_001048 [Salibacteraceae bacterium]|jgi:hypothetical protein